MNAQSFVVLKKTGSLADSTMAVGLAVLLRSLTGSNPILSDRGPHFEVGLPKPVDLDALPYDVLQADPGYLYVKRDDNDPQAPRHGELLDYKVEQAKARAAREARRAGRAAKKVATGAEAGVDVIAARGDWYLFQNLNVLQALGSHNALHAAIRSAEPESLAASVKDKLVAMAQGRDPAEVDTPFSFPVSPVQGFNPIVGKGVNRLKPDGAPVESLDKKYADWFEEWLRYAGTQKSAFAASVGSDIKFVALVPAEIGCVGLTEKLHPELLAVAGRVWSSSLLDVCGALQIAKRLIEGSEYVAPSPDWTLEGVTPRDRVSGISTAYFKSLGTGKATANLSFIGLPGWFPVVNKATAGDWLAILQEHLDIVRFLREDRSEEYTLITAYRDFVSGHDLWSFLHFAAAYAAHVMRAREAGRPVRQLTTTSTGKVVESMNKGYGAIVANEGFRNIARAIRLSTVSEQFQKSRGQQVYEIRYGLYHELRRAAGFPAALIQTVGDFVCSYNAENARAAERAEGSAGPRRRRPQVTTHDLEEFAALVDAHGSEVVAYLLIAYASAREPREGGEADAASPGDTAAARDAS